MQGGGPADAAAPYMGIARTLLGQLKTRMYAGGLAQLSRTVTLEDGARITVSSIHGQDTVRIAVPPVGGRNFDIPVPPDVPPVDIELPEWTPPDVPPPLYLLVVFRNNHVAAIPMSAISGGHWPVEYTATLAHGLSQWVEVAQYNFGVPGCGSVFLAPFSLENHTFTQDSTYYWLNTLRKDNLGPHAARALQTTVSVGKDPMLCAAGSSIWTQDGQYTVQSGAPVLQTRYSVQTNLRGIGPDGTYYYSAGSMRQFLSGNSTWDGSVGFMGAIDFEFGGGVPGSVDLSGVIPNVRTNNNAAGAWSVSGHPGAASAQTQKVTQAQLYTGNHDYSLSIPLPVYERVGVDRFVVTPVPVVANINGTTGLVNGDPLMGSWDKITGTQNMGLWADTYTWYQVFGGPNSGHQGQYNYVNSETGIDSVLLSVFPPPLAVDKVYAAISNADGSVSLNVTPYFSAYGYGPYGWMHLSNGQHCMQAFWIVNDEPTDTPCLYLDGKNVQPQLEAALSNLVPGTLLRNVQAMVMDVPLALIKALV